MQPRASPPAPASRWVLGNAGSPPVFSPASRWVPCPGRSASPTPAPPPLRKNRDAGPRTGPGRLGRNPPRPADARARRNRKFPVVRPRAAYAGAGPWLARNRSRPSPPALPPQLVRLMPAPQEWPPPAAARQTPARRTNQRGRRSVAASGMADFSYFGSRNRLRGMKSRQGPNRSDYRRAAVRVQDRGLPSPRRLAEQPGQTGSPIGIACPPISI